MKGIEIVHKKLKFLCESPYWGIVIMIRVLALSLHFFLKHPLFFYFEAALFAWWFAFLLLDMFRIPASLRRCDLAPKASLRPTTLINEVHSGNYITPPSPAFLRAVESRIYAWSRKKNIYERKQTNKRVPATLVSTLPVSTVEYFRRAIFPCQYFLRFRRAGICSAFL